MKLTKEQIHLIKRFHVFVFSEVLRILQTFLMLDDNSPDAAVMLLVPLLRDTCKINFDVIEENEKMELVEEPSRTVKENLIVTAENYLGHIITPWYRSQETVSILVQILRQLWIRINLQNYLVIKVLEHLNANSPFPSRDYNTYADYYLSKYKTDIVQLTAPLLSVKGISKRLNCIKPRGIGGKRRKDLMYEEMNEELIAEMCVKHKYPAALFIQAHLMPTILYHTMQLLLAEDLRRKIANETDIGTLNGVKWEKLKLDEHLIKYEYKKEEKTTQHNLPSDSNSLALPLVSFDKISALNQDVTAKILEAEFPWKDIEEPKDINRDINVSTIDIVIYENFVSALVSEKERSTRYEGSVSKQQAITYDKPFEEKQIKLLQLKNNIVGPQLSQIYTVLCTAKSNGLVNLERLETLGDSVLKLVSTLYILLKYPHFDEGKATVLKSKLISNKNLFYLGRIKNFGGYILNTDLFPESQWLPPTFTVPRMIQERIIKRELSIANLFYISLSAKEQISGCLSADTLEELTAINDPVEEDEENQLSSLSGYLMHQYIGDKTIADAMEALIGCYFNSNGFEGMPTKSCLKVMLAPK